MLAANVGPPQEFDTCQDTSKRGYGQESPPRRQPHCSNRVAKLMHKDCMLVKHITTMKKQYTF